MTTSTAVETIDAEIVLPEDDAQARTAEIREAASTFTDSYNRLGDLVVHAYRDNVHVAMGYTQDAEGWNRYLEDNVGRTLAGTKGFKRNQLVQTFAEIGMSSRAVAPLLEISQSTAARMLKEAATESNDSAEREVKGLNGKTYPPKQPKPETFKCDRCGGIKDKDTQLNEIGDGSFCEKCADEISEHGTENLPPAPPKTTASTVADDMKLLRDEALAVAHKISALKDASGKSFGKAAQKVLAEIQAAYAEL